MNLLRTLPARRSLFGDMVIVVFLVLQALDGILTYLGLRQYGALVEGNPLISGVIPVLGQGMAVAAAKLFAASLGAILHVTGVHRAIALLTALYLAAAILPWAALLFAR
jgi:hypothetical protein